MPALPPTRWVEGGLGQAGYRVPVAEMDLIGRKSSWCTEPSGIIDTWPRSRTIVPDATGIKAGLGCSSPKELNLVERAPEPERRSTVI